jgi:hypothetical protein
MTFITIIWSIKYHCNSEVWPIWIMFVVWTISQSNLESCKKIHKTGQQSFFQSAPSLLSTSPSQVMHLTDSNRTHSMYHSNLDSSRFHSKTLGDSLCTLFR